MAGDVALLRQLNQWILHRGRSERLLLEAQHDRHVDVDRARGPRIEDADRVASGPPAAEVQLHELLAHLSARRGRLDRRQALELGQHHGRHRDVIAQRI